MCIITPHHAGVMQNHQGLAWNWCILQGCSVHISGLVSTVHTRTPWLYNHCVALNSLAFAGIIVRPACRGVIGHHIVVPTA
jgi:hypothetical protein